MKLTNEVALAAPVERAWELLLDVPRLANALPGAAVEPAGEAGLYRGSMRVKLGPVTLEYEGVVRLQDVDEDERVASFHAQGRERRGQGTAAATITNRLAPGDGHARLVVETDLAVTGRAAQFGRGIMESVAGTVLAEFARRLEHEAAAGAGAPPPAPAEALDLGRVAWSQALAGKAPLALAFGAGLALGLLVGRAWADRP
jgi:carbon monoxide dehydrogenase subunit G